MPRNYLSRLNFIKTLYVNYKLLPFNQAIHLPILLYGKVNVSQCTGKIVIKRPLHFGMLRFGISRGGFNGTKSSSYSRFCIEGTLILDELEQGKGIKRSQFSHDSQLVIGKYGVLVLNEYEDFGPRCRIGCNEKITIGSWLSTSWDVQIFDTNFHYLVSEDGKVGRNTKPVSIGSHCWIGNRTTLNPGAQIGDYSVIASNSLVNKDFSDINRAVLGGVPAVMLKQGVRRIFSFKEEDRLYTLFAENPDLKNTIVNKDIL